jgi:hypothetical protein
MSESSLIAISRALRIDPTVVLRGFDLRRQDYALAKSAKEKAAHLLTYLMQEKEPA